MKIAITYDWVNHKTGGAERILRTLHEIYPDAPLYTSVYDSKKAGWAKIFPEIKTSFLQKLPGASKFYRQLAPLLPIAFEQFNFDQYDLVISVTTGPAKAIITKPHTKHVCYCLTPPRYLWERKFIKSNFIFSLLSCLRKQDYFISKRPDKYLTISRFVQARIKKHYQQEADIVYPGVDIKKFAPISKPRSDYFLYVGRLIKYKQVSLLIKAFNKLGNFKLRIIGTGRQEKYFKKIANKNIKFLGEISEQELIKQYQNCKALIMPQIEDFGLTALEAQACGRPVIAFNQGGCLETVVENKTGTFFNKQTIKSLSKIIKNFDYQKYKPKICRQNAKKFSLNKFKKNFVYNINQ